LVVVVGAGSDVGAGVGDLLGRAYFIYYRRMEGQAVMNKGAPASFCFVGFKVCSRRTLFLKLRINTNF
jgi:hypothetical protein